MLFQNYNTTIASNKSYVNFTKKKKGLRTTFIIFVKTNNKKYKENN